MKRLNFVSVIIFVTFFYQNLSYPQDSTSAYNKNKVEEVGIHKYNLEKLNEETRLLLQESERNFELASKIIDWSAMFFAVLVIVLGIAGWIGARRFNQIDETGKKMFALLEKMKNELLQMQQLKIENQKTIDEFKIQIEKDRKEIIELVYYMNQGENAFEKGDLEKAIEIYTKIIKLKPDSPEAHYMLANTFSANGNYLNAIDHFKKAIDLRPEYYEAFYNLGRTYRRSSDFELSIKYLTECLKINPNFVPAMFNLGVTYLRMDELEKAMEWYQKSTANDPNYSFGYLGLARIAYKKGEIEKSIGLYNKAKEKIQLKINKGNFRHWDIYDLGEIYLVLSNIQKAESQFQKAFSMNAAKETLRTIKHNIELLKFSPKPPQDIDRVIKLFDDKLTE